MDFQQRPLQEIATAAKTASTSIGAFGGELKRLNQAINPTTKDIGAFGSKVKQASKAQSDVTKASEKTVQSEKKKTESNRSSSEMSIAMSLALSTSAGVISSFSDKLKSSDNGLAAFTGELVSATSNVALFIPTLMQINSMMAGGFAGGFKKLTSLLNTRVTMPRVAARGRSALRGVGGLVGGGAVAGAATLGVAAAGAVAYSLYQRRVKEAQRATDKLAENMKKSAENFEKLSSALDKTIDLSKDYSAAINEGDVAKQNSIKIELALVC